jgi:hypothetical protein
VRVAQGRRLNLGVGDENSARSGRDGLEHCLSVWGVVCDGDLIYASDIVRGLYVLDLIGD